MYWAFLCGVNDVGLLVERGGFAFLDDWENESQCGQDKWSDDIECSRCDITLDIHAHNTASGGDNEIQIPAVKAMP